MPKAPTTQIPGVYRRKVGDMVVTAIADGFLDGAIDVLIDALDAVDQRSVAEGNLAARRFDLLGCVDALDLHRQPDVLIGLLAQHADLVTVVEQRDAAIGHDDAVQQQDALHGDIDCLGVFILQGRFQTN